MPKTNRVAPEKRSSEHLQKEVAENRASEKMVVFEPLDDPLEVIPLPLKLFHLVGVSRRLQDRRRLYATLCYLLVFFFIPKIFLGYDNIPQGFRGIAEGLFAGNTCLPLFLLPFKLDKFEELIQGLRLCIKAGRESEEFTSIIIALNKAIHKFTKYYFLFTILIVIGMTLSTISGAIYIFYSHTPGQPLYIPLMMEHRFYALDSHRNILHAIIHTLLLTPSLYLLIVAFTAKAGSFFGTIRFCSTIFHILHLKIEQMRFITSPARYLEELKTVIELHQLTISCTQLLQEILMYILFAQFTGCVLIWCFFLYYVKISGFTADAITAVIMLLSFSLDTFIYSLLGNDLSIKAEQISSSVYASNWYEQPVHIQKLILPIVQKAQRKVGITAAKFYYVDVNRYGKNLKTAYSFYLILKDIL